MDALPSPVNITQTQNVAQLQNTDTLSATTDFPNCVEGSDELTLPEDYHVGGLIWRHDYFPEKWFQRERAEDEGYFISASTVKGRKPKFANALCGQNGGENSLSRALPCC